MPRPTDDQRDEGRWFFAFSDPTRLALLRVLATSGTMIATELAAAVGLQSPSLGTHLNKLERAGLIATGRDGASRQCSLANAKVTKTAIEFTHPSGQKATIPRG